jgi:hypothetical protein
MNPIEKLNGKKGLLAIALLMAVVMALPFAPQFYTWNTKYSIVPLTANIGASINIPPTSGATCKIDLDVTPSPAPTITTQKDNTKVYFMVKGSDYGKQLEDDYYSLTLHFILSDVGTADLVLVKDGAWASKADGSYNDISAYVTVSTAGSYNVTITVDYWTGALESATGTKSFVVNIYAVEFG